MIKWLGVLLFLSISYLSMSQDIPTVNLTSEDGTIAITLNNEGQLQVNVPSVEATRFKSQGWVSYADLGAVGDGKSDDMIAIAGTHAFANVHGLEVRAVGEPTYYIGGAALTAIIETDTDFGNAKFIIEDTDVEDRNTNIFLVHSIQQAFKPVGITTLQRNQEKIEADLPGPCLITVTNDKVKRYIRYGPNQNNGSSQTDIFMVDGEGNVDMKAPIVWDFEDITDISALPIDQKVLMITGGHFTTIANQAPSKYTYYQRGIAIQRSNVMLDGLEHHIIGEGDHGAPYGGFIRVSDCYGVTVKNTILTGHKTYRTVGSAGVPVSMGSYDILVNRAVNVSFVNCRQTNDIDDRTYWGIMGSNFSKNLTYDQCTFSRFDAHMGVANATIRNSTMGHMGINAIGTGTLLVENSTIRGRTMVNLRSDYGSTWEGELVIRNCEFIPNGGKTASASLIGGRNNGQHNFGYTCYMPEKITIENLHINDSNHPEDYMGPTLFANFNPELADYSYVEAYPYVITKEVILQNITTASGKNLRISDNSYMFERVKLTRE